MTRFGDRNQTEFIVYTPHPVESYIVFIWKQKWNKLSLYITDQLQ